MTENAVHNLQYCCEFNLKELSATGYSHAFRQAKRLEANRGHSLHWPVKRLREARVRGRLAVRAGLTRRDARFPAAGTEMAGLVRDAGPGRGEGKAWVSQSASGPRQADGHDRWMLSSGGQASATPPTGSRR